MVKQKITFNCSNCDYRPPKWVGCCPECNEWGSVNEVQPITTKNSVSAAHLTSLEHIPNESQPRMLSGIGEWDRVIGNGIMPGSFLILTGDPGIGKSTLLLQIIHQLAQHHKIIYFSSEESLVQVKQRAQRLACTEHPFLLSDQAELESIIATTEQEKPNVMVVDSIQNCYSTSTQITPGSVSQLREAAFRFMRLAKEHMIAVILTGHITKEGVIAGPKMLEHMVDGVFYLQGEDHWQTRVLRSVKNRFGPVHELGFFQMMQNGLQEVPDINQQLLNDASFSPGSALISYREGSRPLLLELQALTIPSKFGIPQRVVTGIDQKQVVLMAAILEKYLQIKLSCHDIFFKISGGFRIKESSADLGIAIALLSSYFQQPLSHKSIALGEISLTGQIKPINHIGIHIKEAQKFGIEQLIVSKQQKIENPSCKVLRLHNVYELISLFSEN